MSSMGSLGGSSSGTTGGVKQALSGLDLGGIMKQFGQGIGAGQGQQPMGVQPGKMAQMSPQQRMMQVMQQYSGG